MPFVEVSGSGERAAPAQIAATGLKVGVGFGDTVTTPLTLVVPFQKPPPFGL